MNNTDPIDLRAAFFQYADAEDKALYANSDYEAEQQHARAAAAAAPWITHREYAGDWAFLAKVRQQWLDTPDQVRDVVELTRSNPAPTGQTDQQKRLQQHLGWSQQVFDPVQREHAGWMDHHHRMNRLQAQLAASNPETSDGVIAQIDELSDQTNWPQSWKDWEAEALVDPQFWEEQSEEVNGFYREEIARQDTEQAGPVETVNQAAPTAEVQVPAVPCDDCGEQIHFVASPTGGWWSHESLGRAGHDGRTQVRVREEMNDHGYYEVVGVEVPAPVEQADDGVPAPQWLIDNGRALHEANEKGICIADLAAEWGMGEDSIQLNIEAYRNHVAGSTAPQPATAVEPAALELEETPF